MYRTLDASYPLSCSFYTLWPAYAPLPITRLDDRKLKERTVKPVLDSATKEIIAQKTEVTRLKAVADQHPFYKYNGLWTRELQNLVRTLPSVIID